MRDPAYVCLIMLCFCAVIVNGLLKGLEGVDGLLENLDYRDPADIFGPRFGHPILGGLIFCHDLSVFTSHHDEH